jgi:hypothetical protein
VVYGLAVLDRRGRLVESRVLRALGWSPELRLDIGEADGVLVIHADPAGVFRMTRQGHLRLPARVRSWCGLVAGDRVLLAADPAQGRLVVHPPVVVDAMIAARDAQLRGGEST